MAKHLKSTGHSKNFAIKKSARQPIKEEHLPSVHRYANKAPKKVLQNSALSITQKMGSRTMSQSMDTQTNELNPQIFNRPTRDSMQDIL